MRVIGILLIVLLTFVVASAQERGPSTPEERATAVKLQSSPNTVAQPDGYAKGTTSEAPLRSGHLVGALSVIDVRVRETSRADIDVLGERVTGVRFRLDARTRTQFSCNYGDPSRNEWQTVDNPVEVIYIEDASRSLEKLVLDDVASYFDKQLDWARRYGGGSPDFTLLPFHKSFIPYPGGYAAHIEPESELPNDQELFYLNGALYVVRLLEGGEGWGRLSGFVEKNMRLDADGHRIDVRNRLRNLVAAAGALADARAKSGR